MSKDLTKKAAEILLKGGTLLSEHCPYCSGVRVMKDGHALCISCGREPEKKDITKEIEKNSTNEITTNITKGITKEVKNDITTDVTKDITTDMKKGIT